MHPHPTLLREPHLTPVDAAFAIGVAVVGAAALAGAVAWCGPVDRPGARTSHERPTPTSGGLAILAATATAFALTSRTLPTGPDLHGAVIALAAACAMGLLGALDDLADVGARLKLLLGAATAVAVALLLPPVEGLPIAAGLALPLAPWIAVGGAALWIVTAANAVNFMDGANGLAPGGMVTAFAALALGTWRIGDTPVALAALAAAAAGLGFLPWNLRGRLFQGDVGALFSGFLFAGLHLAAATRTGGERLPLYFGPIALLPALTDVLLTLLRRARGRRPLLKAHREHLYQRWLAANGGDHLALAWRGWAAMALAGAAALGIAAAGASVQPRLSALAVTASILAWAAVNRRMKG